MRTVIGHGSSIQGSHKVHGAPLGATDLAHVKTQYGFNPDESFVVPDDVREVYTSRSGCTFDEWVTLFAAYSSAHPYLAGEFGRRMKGELPADWKDVLPRFPVEEVSARNAVWARNTVCNIDLWWWLLCLSGNQGHRNEKPLGDGAQRDRWSPSRANGRVC